MMFTAKHSAFFDVEVEFEVTGENVRPITSGPADNWDPGSYEEDGREITKVTIDCREVHQIALDALREYLQPLVDRVHPSHFKIKSE